MATFNQEPLQQVTLSVLVSAISLSLGSSEGETVAHVVRYDLDGVASTLAMTLGGGTQLPVTGQIWPSGLG